MMAIQAPEAAEPPPRVHWVRDETSGLRAVVAIHNTSRGPAFGGCRMWHYPDEAAAERDARRLAEGMSLKNALAGLPFGGGKAVIMAPDRPYNRKALFTTFSRMVDSLQGTYITAEDVGVTTDDMRVVRNGTPHVSGLPRQNAFGGDPSPMTALGVFVSIDQAVRNHLGRSDLSGTTVAVQGLGAVGSALCELLHAAGCKLVVADLSVDRTARATAKWGAQVVAPDLVLAAQVDVVAPCALGAVLNSNSVGRMRASIVAGAANNQLETLEAGDALHARRILYLPDFLVNAGGIISVAREFLGQSDAAAVRQEVERIRERVTELMERSRATNTPTAKLAQAWASSELRSHPA